MSEVLANFALDLGALLREKALDARRASEDASGTSEEQFESGRLIGHYEALSLLTQQATAFGIALDALGLAGFDADRELLGSGSKSD